MWISAAFHIRVIRAYDGLMSGAVAVATTKAVPAATPVGDLALVESYARLCNVSQSSCVALLRQVAENHGLDTGLLPSYVVDSPAGSVVGSSEATAPLTDLLKARGLCISAHDFNLLLEQAGLLQKRTRKTRQKRYADKGGVKSYWCITSTGLAYGKNLTAPESPRDGVALVRLAL